jgi:uncharacterized protein YecE (DUF72 family)
VLFWNTRKSSAVELEVGTSGYSYKEWKGSFYPEDLPASEMLRFYAERFRTVEINNTFYRMPNRDVLEKWASEVPERFTFVLKASQRITHQKRLREINSDTEYFFKIAESLGGRLGPALFQVTPYLHKDVDRLRAFLELVPKDRRIALEFRHESWFDEEVMNVLREKNAALCTSDEEESTLPNTIVPTANFGYLRLRRCDYDDAALAAGAAKISAQPWTDAFIFFKHEDEATGPKIAARFIELSSVRPASSAPPVDSASPSSPQAADPR